jgi:hypothetical protein
MKLLVHDFRNYPCNIPFRTTPQLQTLFPLGLTRRKHCIQELRMSFLETCPYNSLDILTALYASHSLIPKYPKTSRLHRTRASAQLTPSNYFSSTTLFSKLLILYTGS